MGFNSGFKGLNVILIYFIIVYLSTSINKHLEHFCYLLHDVYLHIICFLDDLILGQL